MDACKYLADVSNIFFKGIEVDQNVIGVDDVENIEEFIKAIVYIYLHWCRSIYETEGHDEIFEILISDSKCGFPFIAKSNSHLMVGIVEIKLGVVLHILNAVEKLWGYEPETPILNCHFINLPVINNEAKASMYFLNKNDLGTKGEVE